MYLLSPAADTVGVTTMDEIEIPPIRLVRRFGPPPPGDDYKVSGEYVFTDENGEVFVVHDWKATSLWDASFPTPVEYWAGEEADEISISARDLDTSDFRRWLLQQLTP